MISLLPILLKKLTTFIRLNVSLPNSKPPSYHTLFSFVFIYIFSDFFILVKFSFVHHKYLFCFSYVSFLQWYSILLVTVSVFCPDELSSNGSKGINSQTQQPDSLVLSPLFAPSTPYSWNSPSVN